MTSTSLPARAGAFFGVDDPWQRPRPTVTRADVYLALAVELLGLFSLELARSGGVLEGTDVPAWGQWIAVTTGALLVIGRRRWPLTIALLGAIHMFICGVTMPAVMAQVTLQVVYFLTLLSGVAWARDRRAMVAVVVSIVVFMFAWIAWQFALGAAAQSILESQGSNLPDPGFFPPVFAAVVMTLLINLLYFGGAILGGQAAWRSARQKADLMEQAATITAQNKGLREQAALDERLRIARELHDVVAHHVSAMGIQAGAARRVLARDPAAASEALSQVEQASRDAITQMRGLLGTLRGPGLAEQNGSRGRTTDPAIEDLPALLAEHDAAALVTTYDLTESPTDASARVPTSLSTTIYRTVQEALTNVNRHSTADRASVVVRVDESASAPFVEVEVVDNGRPRVGTSGSGLGQLGIRERAATHRGEVDLGPRVGGGYRVRVRYPLSTGR